MIGAEIRTPYSNKARKEDSAMLSAGLYDSQNAAGSLNIDYLPYATVSFTDIKIPFSRSPTVLNMKTR